MKIINLLLIAAFLASCHQNSTLLEPNIYYFPNKHHIASLPPEFDRLTPSDLQTQWGKELRVAQGFARELDLYRAITAYKRALFLIPLDEKGRKLQAQYGVLMCYYLANKYGDAAEVFEEGDLREVPHSFPGTRNLLLMLYDTYTQLDRPEQAERTLNILKKYDEQAAEKVVLGTAVRSGDLCTLSQEPLTETLFDSYCRCSKSVRKAQTLNAILPGAGYYYVGQKKTAFTSLVLNGLFIAAAVKFFKDDNVAAGLVTLSFESGWYFGGINGAGLAAKRYNECLYSELAKETMLEHKLFPVLLFQKAF